jgi:hypothetical protein
MTSATAGEEICANDYCKHRYDAHNLSEAGSGCMAKDWNAADADTFCRCRRFKRHTSSERRSTDA